jgi:O-antigen ligase
MPRVYAERGALVALAALVCVPFQVWVHHAPLPTFHAEAVTAALGLVCALVAMHAVPGPLRLPTVTLPVLAFAAIVGVQALLGYHAYSQQAEVGILHAAWCALIVVTAARLRGQLGRAPVCVAFAWGLASGAFLAAALAILQVYDLRSGPFAAITMYAPGLEVTRRAYGNVGQANVLADYLALGIVAIAYLRVKRALPLPVIGVVLPILVWVVYLTGSRLAVPYLVALLITGVFWIRSGGTTPARGFTATLGAAVVVFLLLDPVLRFLGLHPGADSPTERLGQLAAGEGGLEVRLMLWRHAWAIFQSAPLLGTGFGSFAQQMFERAAELNQGVAGIDRNAHNLVLHIAAETGLVGLLALGVLAGTVVMRVVATRWDAERALLTGVLAVLAIHSAFEFPLWYTNLLAVFAIALGVIDPRSFDPGTARRLPLVATTAMVMLGAGWIAVQWAAASRVQEVLHPTWGTLRALDRLPAVVERVKGTLFEPALDERIALQAQPDERGLDALIAYVERIRRVMPAPGLVYREATLLALADRDEAARRVAANAIATFPANAESYARLLAEAARTEPRLSALALHVQRLAGVGRTPEARGI